MIALFIEEQPVFEIATKRKASPKASKRGKKPPTISKLIQRLDKLFSSKVRQLSAPIGTLPCFTCRKSFPKKNLQCGHYLSRYYKSARWDEDNCRPQCMMCNMWKRGDLVVYRQNLIEEIGLERVEAVEAKRMVLFRPTREWLEQKIAALL